MSTKDLDDEMASEYDFRGGVRGKYLDAYRAGEVTVVIEPDESDLAPGGASVDDAPRGRIEQADPVATRER